MSSLSYSTLKEAYGPKKNRVQNSVNYQGSDNVSQQPLQIQKIPQIPQTQQSPQTPQSQIKENLMDYGNHDDCYYDKFNINMESCNKDPLQENNNKAKFCDKFTDYSNIDDYSKTNNDENCTPLQAPAYKYPISDSAKKKFKETLDATYMKQTQPTYSEYNKKSDITKIKPYDEDDLDQYLSIENFKDAINSTPPKKDEMINTQGVSQPIPLSKKPEELNDSIEKDSIRFHNKSGELTSLEKSFLLSKMNEENNNKKLKESEKKNRMYSNYINIGLFIFIGIAIILLCDQIAEIAINIGMRKTAKILEPYILKLQQINDREKNNI